MEYKFSHNCYNDFYLIGLSLSLCIRDILAGKENVKDVAYIICGCSGDGRDWEDIIQYYQTNYWEDHAPEARRLCHELRDEGKIFFTKSGRTSKHPSPHIACGHWAECGERIKCKYCKDPIHNTLESYKQVCMYCQEM
jgi:hypothetical protein